MASSSPSPVGADSFVLTEPGAYWPNGERILDEQTEDFDDFEDISASGSLSSSNLAAALIDQEKREGAFLDAVARLQVMRMLC